MAETHSLPASKLTLINWLRQEFHPNRFLPTLVVSLINGLINVIVAISFAMLIFSGDLAQYLPIGIGFMLFGQIVTSVITSLFSSLSGAVSSIQDSPIAILAVVCLAVVRGMQAASLQEKYYTVVFTVAITTILTGVIYYLIGQFKLGNLVRYIPYPVIGGFLAGSGLLLFFGGVSIMTNTPVDFFHTSWLVQPDLLNKWLPGLLFGVLLLLIVRRYSHFLIIPGMILLATLIFYLALWAMNISLPQAFAQGLLPEMLSQSGNLFWQPLAPGDIGYVNWSMLVGWLPSILAVVLVSVIAILLNVTGIEIAIGEDVNLNREMKASGIANILSGLGGSAISYHALSSTDMAYKLKSKSRLIGFLMAAMCLAVMGFGGTLLSYFPTAVLGGLLLFIGLDFMITWFYDGWFKLPKIDYVIVVLITLTITMIGFLEGVGLGLIIVIFIFVVQYSRINAIKHTLNGATYHSNVIRPRLFQQLLCQKGEWTYILELQGFIFFGTASKLFSQIQNRINDQAIAAPKYVVLDMRLVTGLDSSAVFSFEKIIQLARNKNITLVFTGLNEKTRQQMAWILQKQKETCKTFPDLDHGVEWCENELIKTFESVGLGAKPETLLKQIQKVLPNQDKVNTFMKYLEQKEAQKGDYIIHQGEAARGIYFIEKGNITIQLEQKEHTTRVRNMGAGTVVGELGFYLGVKATASVVADEECSLYYLSNENLKRMESEDPEISNALHKFIATLLSERLVQTNDTLQALTR